MDLLTKDLLLKWHEHAHAPVSKTGEKVRQAAMPFIKQLQQAAKEEMMAEFLRSVTAAEPSVERGGGSEPAPPEYNTACQPKDDTAPPEYSVALNCPLPSDSAEPAAAAAAAAAAVEAAARAEVAKAVRRAAAAEAKEEAAAAAVEAAAARAAERAAVGKPTHALMLIKNGSIGQQMLQKAAGFLEMGGIAPADALHRITQVDERGRAIVAQGTGPEMRQMAGSFASIGMKTSVLS